MPRIAVASILVLAVVLAVVVLGLVLYHDSDANRDAEAEAVRAPITSARVELPADPALRRLLESHRARAQAHRHAAEQWERLNARFGAPNRLPGRGRTTCWRWENAGAVFCRDEVSGEGWSYHAP